MHRTYEQCSEWPPLHCPRGGWGLWQHHWDCPPVYYSDITWDVGGPDGFLLRSAFTSSPQQLDDGLICREQVPPALSDTGYFDYACACGQCSIGGEACSSVTACAEGICSGGMDVSQSCPLLATPSLDFGLCSPTPSGDDQAVGICSDNVDRSCFLNPVVVQGAPDPSRATYNVLTCMAPVTGPAAVHATSLGLPGPVRLKFSPLTKEIYYVDEPPPPTGPVGAGGARGHK